MTTFRRLPVAISLGRLFFLVLAVSSLSAEVRAQSPIKVGYYDMVGVVPPPAGSGAPGMGVATQVPPITTAGFTAVLITDPTFPPQLTGLNVLFVQHPATMGNYGAEYLLRRPSIQAAVAAGMVLVIHDRLVTPAAMMLPGGAGITFVRDSATTSVPANNIDVTDSCTFVASGPHGTLTDTNLDNGLSSNHGYATISTLPAGAKVLLHTVKADGTQGAVTFSYPFGSGFVIYSTIPLDLALKGLSINPPRDTFTNIYAPNVLAYAAGLALPSTTTLTVDPADTTYGGTTTLTARLKSASACPEGATVQFSLDGNVVGTAQTDSMGVAALNVSLPSSIGVGSHSIVASFSGTTGSLKASTGTAALTVTKAPATIEVVGGTFVYDGAPHAATGSVTGVFGESLGMPVFSYTDANGVTSESAPVNAGTYDITATSAETDNYLSTTNGSVKITIEKATPTVVVPDTTLTYDGAPHGAAGTVTGVGGADLGPLSFTYTPGPGEPTNAGLYAVLGSYAESANYAAASDTATLTIEKATPTVVVPDSTLTYDGAPHGAAGTVTGLGGADLGALSFTYTPGPGQPTNAGLYAVLGSYAESENYAAASDTATLTIEKATPTVVVPDSTLTYDGAPHGATGTVTGVAGADLGALSFTYTPGPGTPANAGLYAVLGSYAESANYAAASDTATLTIEKATPTVVVPDSAFTYDGVPHGAMGTVTGVGGADLGALSFTYTPGPGAPTNAGPYAVLGSYAESVNYAAASDTATLTIEKATPTVVVPDSAFAYDRAPHGATGTVTGVGGANLGALSFTYAPGPGAPINAGQYAVLGSYAGSANYAAASDTATLTITRAPLTVTADDKERLFGKPNPALTVRYTGLVNGDTPASLDVKPTVTTAAMLVSRPGAYAIVVGGALDANYAITRVNGTLTVSPQGRMRGEGFIDAGGARNHIDFDVRESFAHGERGSVTLRIENKDKGRDSKGRDNKPRNDDRFVSHTVTSVVFSDDPDFAPGRRRRPDVDTVDFTGVGVWNGVDATFEAIATDMGEPGRRRDTFDITIRVKGKEVARIQGSLDDGNVQSSRLFGGSRW